MNVNKNQTRYISSVRRFDPFESVSSMHPIEYIVNIYTFFWFVIKLKYVISICVLIIKKWNPNQVIATCLIKMNSIRNHSRFACFMVCHVIVLWFVMSLIFLALHLYTCVYVCNECFVIYGTYSVHVGAAELVVVVVELEIKGHICEGSAPQGSGFESSHQHRLRARVYKVFFSLFSFFPPMQVRFFF